MNLQAKPIKWSSEWVLGEGMVKNILWEFAIVKKHCELESAQAHIKVRKYFLTPSYHASSFYLTQSRWIFGLTFFTRNFSLEEYCSQKNSIWNSYAADKILFICEWRKSSVADDIHPRETIWIFVGPNVDDYRPLWMFIVLYGWLISSRTADWELDKISCFFFLICSRCDPHQRLMDRNLFH
jgi:hypothetical protein